MTGAQSGNCQSTTSNPATRGQFRADAEDGVATRVLEMRSLIGDRQIKRAATGAEGGREDWLFRAGRRAGANRDLLALIIAAGKTGGENGDPSARSVFTFLYDTRFVGGQKGGGDEGEVGDRGRRSRCRNWGKSQRRRNQKGKCARKAWALATLLPA